MQILLRTTKTFLLTLFLLLGSCVVFADNKDSREPRELVQLVLDDVLAEVRDNAELYADNDSQLQALARERVTPYFNVPRMTQIAMGKYWRQATPEQKKQLVTEVRNLMIRSYAKILYRFRDVNPVIVDETASDENKRLLKLRIQNDAGNPINIFLRFEKHREQWLVVDVNVEGVSIVITARGRFIEEIGKQGIDGLIKTLASENLGLDQ